tara:strand:- start:524 stop:1303 length:780 start_codon:yes stop_codon:yes gene_type:complete
MSLIDRLSFRQCTMTDQLAGCLVPIGELTGNQRDEMFRLMDRHYVNVLREIFDKDLDEKDQVILMTDPVSQQILGFSTQLLVDLVIDSRPVRVLFSGDTIVDPRYWTRNPLATIWGRWVLELIDDAAVPLYWFLISKGYKTYRFLPLFFNEFFPVFDRATPSWASHLIQEFGDWKYPNQFDPELGLLRARPESCRLRPGVADLHPSRLHDDHVRFFAQANPDHARGDELCCVAALTRENFTNAAYRVIARPLEPRILFH